MNVETLERIKELAKQGLSSTKIAEQIGVVQGTILYWFKKENIRPHTPRLHKVALKYEDGLEQACSSCGMVKPIQDFYKMSRRGKDTAYARCKACILETSRQRDIGKYSEVKDLALEYKVGKCIIC